jgi:F-type H+-transporting ATPase subunit gamma
MKMIAASRLRKAQEAILAKRPYAQRLKDVIVALADRADHDDHDLLHVRNPQNVLLLVLTSDRGMCGGFNINISRATVKYVEDNADRHENISLSIIGKKGQDFFGRRSEYKVNQMYRGVFENVGFDKANEIGDDIIGAYIGEGLDAVYMVYNEFKSAMNQNVVVEKLLPIEPSDVDEDNDSAALDFEYEPSKTAVLDEVLPLYVNMQIYRAILESIASEMGARMTAMDAATRNASELISKLTLTYNRARQASITTELMEIIGGAEALKG